MRSSLSHSQPPERQSGGRGTFAIQKEMFCLHSIRKKKRKIILKSSCWKVLFSFLCGTKPHFNPPHLSKASVGFLVTNNSHSTPSLHQGPSPAMEQLHSASHPLLSRGLGFVFPFASVLYPRVWLYCISSLS